MTNPGPAALLTCLLLALPSSLSSEAALFPAAPGPGFAELGARLGAEAEPLPPRSLAEAALLASGLAPDRLPSYLARLEALVAAALANPGLAADAAPAARGEALLAFLHERALRRYEADATGLDQLLDSGRYNCVSSALLYAIAGRAAGLSVLAVRTPDHAFCLLEAPDRDIDVETTNRYGFDPGNKKEFTDSFGRVTGFAYAPPGAYSRRELIGDRVFAGLVLSNRAAILERSGRYREALLLGLDLDLLAPGEESRAFLLDRVNNVAAELSRRRDYGSARAFVEEARASLGDSPRLASLARDAAYNEAAALAQAGSWEAALEAAAELLASYPEAYASGAQGAGPAAARRDLGRLVEACVGNLASARLRAGDYPGARAALAARRGLLESTAGAGAAAAIERRVAEAELAAAVEGLGFAEGLAAAEAAYASGSVSRARWEEAAAFLYGREANRLAATGELLGAASLAEAGASRVPSSRAKLARYAQELRRAFAARAHNEFAALYNAGKYGEALRAVEEALMLAPEDPGLRSDRRAAAEAAARASP